MDKFKLSLFLFLLISFFISIGVFVSSHHTSCCNDSIAINATMVTSTTDFEKKNEEIRQQILTYTSNFIDSINKRDSIYSNHLKEIKNFFKRKAQEKKTDDSCIDCICPNATTYEFNYRDYYKILEKLSQLQKDILSKKISKKTQEELIEYTTRKTHKSKN